MVEIKKEAFEVLELIKSKGYLAYLVGGCVRDFLLNINPSDYDITTNAKPFELMEIFKNYKLIETGLKHGTVTVHYKHIPFEITTFRCESNYQDNRHPDKVEFISSLKEDLERRDFTINALAYDDKVYDYFDGIKDLDKKIIKCVGNPNIRFKEDSLRILRAIRFSYRLHFKVESKTNAAIHLNKDLLKNISIERIISELTQILNYNAYAFVNEYFDLLQVVFPHLTLDCKDDIINRVNNLTNANYLYTLAIIFSYIDKTSLNKEIKQYHLENDIARKIKLLNTVNLLGDCSLISIKKTLKKNNINDIIMYIRYKYDERKQEELIKIATICDNSCHNLKMLAINGNDLINLGITEGLTIKKVLDEILNLVIEDKLPNDRNSLINYVKARNN